MRIVVKGWIPKTWKMPIIHEIKLRELLQGGMLYGRTKEKVLAHTEEPIKKVRLVCEISVEDVKGGN